MITFRTGEIEWYVDWSQIPFTVASLAVSAGLFFVCILEPIHQERMERLARGVLPVEYVVPKEVIETRIDDAEDTRSDFQRRRAENMFYLAATIWGEARNQDFDGMLAVGNVIMNRVANDPDRYGKTIKEVTLRHKQFSCWNGNDPNSRLLNSKHLNGLSSYSKDGIAWAAAQMVAEGLITGSIQDNTKGATHYHTNAIAPYWSKVQKKIVSVGSHIFYR